MAESILEQICQWHLAMIASITTDAGYQQTLTATRSEDLFLAGDTPNDLYCLCCLSAADDAVELEGMELAKDGKTQWVQRLDALVHIIGDGGTGLAVDQRITRVVADIHKRVGVELATAAPYCDNLVYRIEFLPWEIAVVDREHTLVNVPLRFAYEVQTQNPYAQ